MFFWGRFCDFRASRTWWPGIDLDRARSERNGTARSVPPERPVPVPFRPFRSVPFGTERNWGNFWDLGTERNGTGVPFRSWNGTERAVPNGGHPDANIFNMATLLLSRTAV